MENITRLEFQMYEWWVKRVLIHYGEPYFDGTSSVPRSHGTHDLEEDPGYGRKGPKNSVKQVSDVRHFFQTKSVSGGDWDIICISEKLCNQDKLTTSYDLEKTKVSQIHYTSS